MLDELGGNAGCTSDGGIGSGATEAHISKNSALNFSLARRFLCRLKSSSGSSLRLIKIMRRGPIALSLVTFIGIGDDVGSSGGTC